jgi:hypothetical protein
VLGLYLGLGVAWTALHVGHVPRYWDTNEYLLLAKSLKVDQYRGVAYPALLAAANRWTREPLLEPFLWKSTPDDQLESRAMGGFVALQLLQLSICVAGLGYFVYVFANLACRGSARDKRVWSLGLGALVLLLAFDPIVAHHNLAIMTDGLALSASLAFCAAFAQLGLGRGSPWVSSAVLLGSLLLAGGLRFEKSWVALGTAIATVALWKRFEEPADGEAPPRRPLAAFGIVLAGLAALLLLQEVVGVAPPRYRWGTATTILHLRLIHPHLSAIYQDLSPEIRAVITPQQAERYDRNLNEARRVINATARSNVELRERLTREMALTALRQRGPAIAADIYKDVVENCFATLSFYLRLGISAAERLLHRGASDDFAVARWTYSRLRHEHPALSRAYLTFSAALFFVAAALAFAWFRGARRGAARADRSRVLVWIPVGAFCIFNALAFALAQDMVSIRYNLVAHVAGLIFVYSAAIRWMCRPSTM